MRHQDWYLSPPYNVFRGRPQKQPGDEAVPTPSDYDQVRVTSLGYAKQGISGWTFQRFRFGLDPGRAQLEGKLREVSCAVPISRLAFSPSPST